jgi:hypothetical protein
MVVVVGMGIKNQEIESLHSQLTNIFNSLGSSCSSRYPGSGSAAVNETSLIGKAIAQMKWIWTALEENAKFSMEIKPNVTLNHIVAMQW